MKSLLKIFTLAIASLVSACGGGGASTTASNQPQLPNCYPTPAAGPVVQEENAGKTIVLKDLASCASGTAVNYRWTLLSKPKNSLATLAESNVRSPSINADAAGLYVFRFEEIGVTTKLVTLALVAQTAGTSAALSAHTLLDANSVPKLDFAIKPNLNNQGIGFSDGYYYVGYDTTNGNGMIERYSLDGKLDINYGRESVATRHTAELAYRTADSSMYAVSGGGNEPSYVYRLTQNGKAIDSIYDFTAYGTSALLAFENANDLALLMTTASNGDKGDPVFRLVDLNNKSDILLQFSIPNQGVPQGLEIADGIIYLYTNNRITMLDLSGTILGKKDFSIPGESQGMTIVTQGGTRKIAIGYNQPGRIYSFPAK